MNNNELDSDTVVGSIFTQLFGHMCKRVFFPQAHSLFDGYLRQVLCGASDAQARTKHAAVLSRRLLPPLFERRTRSNERLPAHHSFMTLPWYF